MPLLAHGDRKYQTSGRLSARRFSPMTSSSTLTTSDQRPGSAFSQNWPSPRRSCPSLTIPTSVDRAFSSWCCPLFRVLAGLRSAKKATNVGSPQELPFSEWTGTGGNVPQSVARAKWDSLMNERKVSGNRSGRLNVGNYGVTCRDPRSVMRAFNDIQYYPLCSITRDA